MILLQGLSAPIVCFLLFGPHRWPIVQRFPRFLFAWTPLVREFHRLHSLLGERRPQVENSFIEGNLCAQVDADQLALVYSPVVYGLCFYFPTCKGM